MISIFNRANNPISSRNLDEASYFDGIKNGQWQDSVLGYRAGKVEKATIEAVTASGIFKERKAGKMIEHSNFICLDIDAKDQICTIDIDAIKTNEYTYAVHKSLGGFGYAVFVKIDGTRHLDSFMALEQYYFSTFSIVLDKSCKDVSRLRFVSYDPDIFINEKAKTFKKYLPKKEVKKYAVKPIVVKSDFDEMVSKAASMNLFDSYEDYILCAFSISSEFGIAGEDYFHALCSSSAKYNQTTAEKDYAIACKREGSVTIASVYYKFKEAGISLTSEKTELIKSVAKLSENPTKTLKEFGINDIENLAEKFKPSQNKEKTEIDLIIDLIKYNNFRFNEITRNFEINNEELNDRLLSKFYTLVWQKIDENISKDKIWTLIQNRDITKPYNPIHQWFENNKNLQTSNELEKLYSCFDISHTFFDDEGEECIPSDYLQIYLRKWLIGIIGSAYGTYSLMILVMSGDQGTKKTEFFRNLLPAGLRKFYAESNLDEGKDSEILMTKKLLIIDDEFGGKSKKDATKLKRLSSQQSFSIRMPYGKISEDLQRLAVLGGTSNDSEIINDPTGNRRIIPINLISFDFDTYISIDKNKLFIELYNEYNKDITGWFLTKKEIEFLNKSTIKNMEVMSEVEMIDKCFVPSTYNKMTNTEVKSVLENKFPSLKTNSKRIGQALKICGYGQILEFSNGKTKRNYNCSVI